MNIQVKDNKKSLKIFLKSKIGYASKENYRNLEIADEIEYQLNH
jgi:hypothetical protein